MLASPRRTSDPCRVDPALVLVLLAKMPGVSLSQDECAREVAGGVGEGGGIGCQSRNRKTHGRGAGGLSYGRVGQAQRGGDAKTRGHESPRRQPPTANHCTWPMHP